VRHALNREVTRTRGNRGQRTLTLVVIALLLVSWPALPVAASVGSGTANVFALQSIQIDEPVFSTDRDLPQLAIPGGAPMLSPSPIPGVTARSVFAVDTSSDSIIYQYNADEPIAPASTLKIVTALTALTVLEPDDLIQVSEADLVDTTVYSNAALQHGDLVTVRDLLAGLMIPSGGDAANALARVIGGRLGPAPGQHPVNRFVDEMNDLAISIGMRNSNFVNPDGPDDPDQYTTARDLAIASDTLLQNNLLAEIVAAPAWTITVEGPNARRYDVYNTNELIGVDRVHGVKTGTTGQAGQSVVLATRRGGNTVLTVVMGSEQRYQDTLILLQRIDSQVRWVHFGASSDFPGIQSAADRFSFSLVVPFVEPMLIEDSDRLSATLDLGPRPRGTLPVPWGRVVFLQDGEELYQVPVLRTGDSRD
jgi:D-alanyl-D-alanine carboxypeptidase